MSIIAIASCVVGDAPPEPDDGPLDVSPEQELVPDQPADADDLGTVDDDLVDDADISYGDDAGVAPAASVPAACPLPAQVLVYSPRGSTKIGKAIVAALSPCARYEFYVSPYVADKTQPRAEHAADRIHAQSAQFTALAGFSFQAWRKVTNLTWYQKGVEFRRRMAAAGYDVTRGDSWAIDELPSTTRYVPSVRIAVRNLVRGLHDGPAGAPKARGTVFMIGHGQTSSNVSVLHAREKQMLGDAAFWRDMQRFVTSFAQETYPSPSATCDAAERVGARATAVADYAMHLTRLATAGGSHDATASSYLAHHYMPLLSAVFRTKTYGDTRISLDQMINFESTEVYAIRTYAQNHPIPGGRIGVAWYDSLAGVPDDQFVQLAVRLAASIRDAYSTKDQPVRACSPSGAFTFCHCDVAGARLNPLWDAFSHW